MNREEIAEKLAKGWIRARIYIEVMATDEKLTETTLKGHVSKLKGEKDVIIATEEYEAINPVENPMREIKQAFTQIVNLEILVRSVETLLYTVIFYGPSSIEILEPKELRIGTEEIQTMLNTVADVMHRFAAAGVGGVVIPANK